MSSALGDVKLKAAPVSVKQKDGRSELLSAIRTGKNLRKVEVQEKKPEEKPQATNDVAAILMRRMAMEGSDSEDDGDDDDDDSGWDD